MMDVTRVPGENDRVSDTSQVTADKLYHIMLYRVNLAMNGYSNSQRWCTGTRRSMNKM